MNAIKALLWASLTHTLMLSPVLADSTLPLSQTPLTLDIHFHTRNYVYNNDWPVEKEAFKLTNIRLNNVTTMGSSDSEEAFNLMIASGALPDIVGGSSLQRNVNQYGPAGAFIPLEALIEQHAPNIKAFFKQHPTVKNAIRAADGQVYYIPYLPDGKFGRGYFIRSDWLKKLNLAPPDNVHELYQVLVAFRDGDPNGNGIKDEVPIFMRHWEELIRLVTLWDGRSSGSDRYHDFFVVQGKIQHGYVGEGYKRGIRNLAKWYKEGLIDRDIFTREGHARQHFLTNNLGGMTHDWFASTASYNDTLRARIPGFEFKAFIPPASITGKRVEEHRRAKVKFEGWAISARNQYPIETIKYFDFFFSETGRRLANYGIEEKQYRIQEQQPVFLDTVLNAAQPVNQQLWQIGAQIPRGFPQDKRYEQQWTNREAREGIALYEQGDYLLPPFLGVSLTPEESDKLDQKWRKIRTYMLEMQHAWITGQRDIDKDWTSYLSQINRMGFKSVRKIMQTAYDRHYKP